MNRYCLLAIGPLALMTGMGRPLSAEPTTLLENPRQARAVEAASPKLDHRVFVYSGKTISSTVLEHTAGSDEVLLSVGAREGARLGQAFQLRAEGAERPAGIARVIELRKDRCVARLGQLDPAMEAQSVKGFRAVCSAPEAKKNELVVQCTFDKGICQTESLENKLIRGLLDTGGDQVKIVIREDTAD